MKNEKAYDALHMCEALLNKALAATINIGEINLKNSDGPLLYYEELLGDSLRLVNILKQGLSGDKKPKYTFLPLSEVMKDGTARNVLAAGRTIYTSEKYVGTGYLFIERGLNPSLDKQVDKKRRAFTIDAEQINYLFEQVEGQRGRSVVWRAAIELHERRYVIGECAGQFFAIPAYAWDFFRRERLSVEAARAHASTFLPIIKRNKIVGFTTTMVDSRMPIPNDIPKKSGFPVVLTNTKDGYSPF